MKVAIIGCSGMGRVHAEAIQRAGYTVALCADKAKKAATALANECGAQVAASPEKALADKSIDAVLVATPTPFHLPYVEAAAKAGKHIFCEKPFCRTEAECKKAIDAAKKAGVKLFVGHVVRYFHEFECIKAQVEAGAIGDPGFVKISRGGIFPGGMNSWFANYELSGGVTLDCMIHDMDWVRYVFGEPERIFCRALMRSTPRPIDYSQVTMRTKSGIIATIIGTWAHPAGFRVKAEVCGSEGVLLYDSAEAPIQSIKRDDVDNPDMIVPASPVNESPYQREWSDFGAWVTEGREPRVHARDGMIAVRMAEAALKSAKTGKPVRL